MKAVVNKGRFFIGELLRFFLNVVSILSWPRLCWSVFLGVAAKLSLMISFLVIVKLTSAYVMGEQALDSSGYMGIFLMFFIPCALSLSGSSLYFDMRFKIKYEHLFVRHLRKLHVNAFLRDNNVLDNVMLTKFINVEDSKLSTAAVAVFHALFELVQSVLILMVIIAFLFYSDWVIGLLLLLALVVITPLFVYWGKKKQHGVTGDLEKVKACLNSMKLELYQTATPSIPVEYIVGPLNAILFGDEASEVKKELDQRKLDSRKGFPFIYGFIGIMFVVLVYASFSGSARDISAEQLAVWVIIFFVLRFMAAAVQSMKNGLVSLFSNYTHIQKINSVLP